MTFLKAAIAATTLFLAAPAVAHDGVHIMDAHARFLPGAKSGVAYLVIENHAAVDERLLSITTDVAERAEVHESRMTENGTMTMAPVDGGLVIPAETSVELKQGSYHVMLMMLKRQPKAGEQIHLLMTFEHAGKVGIDVPVDSGH